MHLQGRFLNPGLFSSFSRIVVARWMHRRHDECTAAISTSALKESDGPSYFHLINGDLIVNKILHEEVINFWHILHGKESKSNHNLVLHLRFNHHFLPISESSFSPCKIKFYLNDWLYASGFSARYFIFLATGSISPSSLICKIEPGEGAKSWIFGAPTTTGTEPTDD